MLSPFFQPLLRFFMRGALAAVFAELLQFQTVLQGLLVLGRVIVNLTACRAFKFDEIILRHTG